MIMNEPTVIYFESVCSCFKGAMRSLLLRSDAILALNPECRILSRILLEASKLFVSRNALSSVYISGSILGGCSFASGRDKHALRHTASRGAPRGRAHGSRKTRGSAPCGHLLRPTFCPPVPARVPRWPEETFSFSAEK